MLTRVLEMASLTLSVGLAAFGSMVTASPLVSQEPSLEPVTGPPLGQVSLRNTYQYRLKSRINGTEYRIQIALPLAYNDSSKADTTRYPVMYLLDGNLELPLMAGMFRLSNRGIRGDGTALPATEQLIFVGVGYPPGDGVGPPLSPAGVPYRQIDYSLPPFPTHKPQHKDWPSEQPWAGGAPRFLRVLKEEIIPLIDRRFRTTQDRGIHGHSMGGLFAAYVLFTDPDLFSRYAITSASVWWDSSSILLRQEEFAKNRSSLPKQVFLSVGSQEGAGEISEMWQLVTSICYNIAVGRYKGMKITAEILPDEYHGSVVPFSRALKALYPPIHDDPRVPTHPCMGW